MLRVDFNLAKLLFREIVKQFQSGLLRVYRNVESMANMHLSQSKPTPPALDKAPPSAAWRQYCSSYHIAVHTRLEMKSSRHITVHTRLEMKSHIQCNYLFHEIVQATHEFRKKEVRTNILHEETRSIIHQFSCTFVQNLRDARLCSPHPEK